MGRPTVITEEVVRKLEQAFADGFNVVEACFNTGISRDTYYRHLDANTEFSYRMNSAQSNLTSKAKSNIAKAINNGDVGTSRWYISREDRKDEYNSTAEPPKPVRMIKDRPGLSALTMTTVHIKGILIKQLIYLKHGKKLEYAVPSKTIIDNFFKVDEDKQLEIAVHYLSNQNIDHFLDRQMLDTYLYLTRDRPQGLRFHQPVVN